MPFWNSNKQRIPNERKSSPIHFCVYLCVRNFFFLFLAFSPLRFPALFRSRLTALCYNLSLCRNLLSSHSTTQGLTQPIKLNLFIWFASPKTWRISFAFISLLFLFPLLGISFETFTFFYLHNSFFFVQFMFSFKCFLFFFFNLVL